MAARFEVYKDAGGNFRWRLFAGNNENIASGGESFSSKQAAVNGCEAVKRAASVAEIEVKE
jgi:uncharacterized protein YegP (UPF0339 family)